MQLTAIQDGTAETTEGATTLGQLFARNCEQWGSTRVALRHKRYGIWNKYSWADSYAHVKSFSLGLVSLGLRRGDKVAVLGDIEPELYWGMFGIWAAGAATVGIHVDSLPAEVQYTIDHADAVLVLTRDQEQVDKLLRIKGQLPKVLRVIWCDPRGMRNYDDDWLISFRKVVELGAAFVVDHPTAWEENIAQSRPDDLAAVYYTSGTTGLPKGCCHSHRSLISLTAEALRCLGVTPGSDTMAYSSVATIGEPILGSVAHLYSGVRLNIPEKPETFTQDLREIAPAYVVFAPRQWEGMASTIQDNVGEADWIKRFSYRQFLRVGYRYAAFLYKKDQPPLLLRALHAIGEALVFRPVRDRVGMAGIRKGVSFGYTIGEQTLKFLHALGIDVRSLYGSTEQGITAAHTDGNVCPESAGAILPSCEAQMSPEGELLVRSPGLFTGYYKDDAANDKAFRDGWFHTGDTARIDERKHIFLSDRLAETCELATGVKLQRQFIESQLRFGSHIRDVVVVAGKQRTYVTAVITVDLQAAGKWAERHGITYETQIELSQKDEIADRVLNDILRVNKTLPAEARVRKFVVLHKEFDADEGELTRTRKIKRNVVESRYANMIEAMYVGETEVKVSAQVTYQDGRTRTITAGVKVRQVPAAV